MEKPEPLACRVAACRESGGAWSFHLLNDTESPIDFVVVDEVIYDFGGMGSAAYPRRRVEAIPPGGHAEIWTDDDDAAEVNMDLVLHVGAAETEWKIRFEFPKLYRMRNLPSVDGLGDSGGRAGWEESPSSCRRL